MTIRPIAIAAALFLVACGGSTSSGSTDVPPEGITWSDVTADGYDAQGKDVRPADALEEERQPEPADGAEDAPDADDGTPDARVDAHDATPEADADHDVRPDVPDTDQAEAAPDDVATDPGTTDTSLPPPPLFDLPAIRDASTATCTFTNHHTTIKDGAILDAWDVSYQSWESIDGVLTPITIRGFLAKPVNGTNLPGVVQAHGLGGCATENNATGPAALLGMVVLAYTGPGGGDGDGECAESEGKGAGADNGYHLFDTLTDPRESWFWGHPVAAMRGITCLQTRSDVDPARIGVTGFSAGGVASLVVAGADDRVKASVPLSASGHWEVAVQSSKAWQNGLLQAAGLSIASPEWAALLAVLDPAVVVANSKAPVMMVNGTSDEFFPLTAHVPTLQGITQAETRTSLSGNFDHGCYALTGGESADTIAARAELHAKGAQRMWLRHYLTSDPDYAYVPATPTLTVQPQGGGLVVTATVDGGGSALAIESVKFWWSLDDAFLWGSNELEPGTGLFAGVWYALLPVTPAANLVSFVDVQYKTKGFPVQRFTVSSVPVLPAGFVPHIRDQMSCL